MRPYNIVYNILSNAMYFKAKEINLKKCPSFEFSSWDIEFITHCKYLGAIVEQNRSVNLMLKDKWQNCMLKQTHLGVNSVYIQERSAFQSFCANLYCYQFWYNTKKRGLGKIKDYVQ